MDYFLAQLRIIENEGRDELKTQMHVLNSSFSWLGLVRI